MVGVGGASVSIPAETCSQQWLYNSNQVPPPMAWLIVARLKFIQYKTGVWNAMGAFLQTPAPVLDNISGAMGARFLSSTGLRSGSLIGRAQFPQHPALDKNWSPTLLRSLADLAPDKIMLKSWRTMRHHVSGSA